MKIFLPTADIFTDLVQRSGKRRVFFLVQTTHFPCGLHEEFEKIQLCRGSYDESIFLISSGVASQKD